MRETKSVNLGWSFTKQGETVTVNLPHTWNGKDGQDGGNDYYRGTCVYEKELKKRISRQARRYIFSLTA